MDNHSCKECHEKIYEEYESSVHAQGYFGSTLHPKSECRKVIELAEGILSKNQLIKEVVFIQD